MSPLAARRLRPVRKVTVVDDIIGQIKGLLRRNRFTAGTRLPSERDLARKLGVSRPSVREALRTLEQLGVLDTRQGSGTQVATSGSRLLKTPLEFLLMLDQPTIAEVHETRALLEIHLAGRAAERRTDEDLRAMEQAMAEMRAHLARPHEVTDPDVRFHGAIATAAHNRLLERMMHCIQENIRSLIDAAWPGNRSMRSSHESHEKILRAIRRREAAAARRAMTEHMDITREELRRVGLIR
jgi:GntR family transcriptional repressor for pyruvate dehydrogenase complex